MPAIAAADVERYVKMRARLVAASEALARATSAESAAAATGSALVALTGAQHAAVFFRSTNGVVTCPWYHHLSESYVRELTTPDGVNPWVHLVRHPELACMDLPRGGRKRSPAPWLLPDVYELPVRYTVRQRVLREGMRSICSWPLSRGDRTIGAVAYYFDTPHISSEPEQEILRVFASQAAMAVENGITARALGRSATKAEVSAPPPVRIRTGVEVDAIRLAETLRTQELAIERPAVAEAGVPLPAEYRRLADVQAALSAETERLAELQRVLRSETQQLADAREALNAAETTLSRDRQTLDAEAAR
ncbi:MAG TPA: GAF domain-containing protein, partial [bacterium]|nr:GAF domain-containing protein [bacterium]